MEPTVYIETSIPSYLTANPNRNLVQAAKRLSTLEWWDQRDKFDLFVSQLVVDECQAGDEKAASRRLDAILNIPLLKQVPEVANLAQTLIGGLPLPKKAVADAFHIATAAIHGLQYLLTWNCTHIANVTYRRKIEKFCRLAGVEPPLICTPLELKLGEESHD